MLTSWYLEILGLGLVSWGCSLVPLDFLGSCLEYFGRYPTTLLVDIPRTPLFFDRYCGLGWVTGYVYLIPVILVGCR